MTVLISGILSGYSSWWTAVQSFKFIFKLNQAFRNAAKCHKSFTFIVNSIWHEEDSIFHGSAYVQIIQMNIFISI